MNVTGDGATFVAAGDQECTEVIVVSSAACEVKSAADPGTAAAFLVPANTYFTVRGLTNANQVSIKTTGSVTAYVRAQYYSSQTPAVNP